MVLATKEARKNYRLGTWNVRTLRMREEEVIREMTHYNIDVLGLSETKVRGNGMKEIGGAKYIRLRWSDRRESEVRCGDNRSRTLGGLHQKLEVYQRKVCND